MTLLSKCVEIHKSSFCGLFNDGGWTLGREELFSILLNPCGESKRTEVTDEEEMEDSNQYALQDTSEESENESIMDAEDFMVLHALLSAFMKHTQAKVSIVFVRKSDKAQASLYKNPRAFCHIEPYYNMESALLPALPAFRIIMKGQSFFSGRITNIFVSLKVETRPFIRDAKIRFEVSEVSIRMRKIYLMLLEYIMLYMMNILLLYPLLSIIIGQSSREYEPRRKFWVAS